MRPGEGECYSFTKGLLKSIETYGFITAVHQPSGQDCIRSTATKIYEIVLQCFIRHTVRNGSNRGEKHLGIRDEGNERAWLPGTFLGQKAI